MERFAPRITKLIVLERQYNYAEVTASGSTNEDPGDCPSLSDRFFFLMLF